MQAVLDLPVDIDGSAYLIFSLPDCQREKAYARLRRLHLLKALRNGFRPALAHHIADVGDARIRELVLSLSATEGSLGGRQRHVVADEFPVRVRQR